MFFSFFKGLWSHVKRVNLFNDLELNGFFATNLILLSNNIFFGLLDNNAMKHIFEGKFQ